jgi:metal-responsive CopG/Arc/MetJ family transcriptional regulator
MRIRTNIILEEDLLTRIDIIAGDKKKRAAVIERALREFLAREESKAPTSLEVETADVKAGSRTK